VDAAPNFVADVPVGQTLPVKVMLPTLKNVLGAEWFPVPESRIPAHASFIVFPVAVLLLPLTVPNVTFVQLLSR